MAKRPKYPKNQVYKTPKGRWRARLRLPEFGRVILGLGTHDTEEEARAAAPAPKLVAYLEALRAQ